MRLPVVFFCSLEPSTLKWLNSYFGLINPVKQFILKIINDQLRLQTINLISPPTPAPAFFATFHWIYLHKHDVVVICYDIAQLIRIFKCIFRVLSLDCFAYHNISHFNNDDVFFSLKTTKRKKQMSLSNNVIQKMGNNCKMMWLFL